MIRYTINFFIMIILFLGGVIIGFDQAGEGMDKISGNNNETYDAVKVEQQDHSVEVAVMGESLNQKSLEDKKEDYQEINEDFITERLAGAVESGVKWFFSIIINGASQIVEMFYKS